MSPAEVNKQFETAIAEQHLGGDAAFAQQLARQNTTEARLRDRYKTDLERQMTADRLVKKVIPMKPVPQAEAEAYYVAAIRGDVALSYYWLRLVLLPRSRPRPPPCGTGFIGMTFFTRRSAVIWRSRSVL